MSVVRGPSVEAFHTLGGLAPRFRLVRVGTRWGAGPVRVRCTEPTDTCERSKGPITLFLSLILSGRPRSLSLSLLLSVYEASVLQVLQQSALCLVLESLPNHRLFASKGVEVPEAAVHGHATLFLERP